MILRSETAVYSFNTFQEIALKRNRTGLSCNEMSSEYHFTDCKWLPANHFLFQMANVCLVASYFAPDSLNGLFMLRASLGLGGLFFALWGWWILCAPDTFGWNVLFMVFNFAHLAYMVYQVKKPRRFSHDAERVYRYLFEPLGVQRYQFDKIANISSTLRLPSGEIYGKEDSPAERIGILLSGGMEARKSGKLLHIMRQFEFVDSPEWATYRPGILPRYGVTLVTSEESSFLVWDSSNLRRALDADKILRNIFNSVIGQDVTNKLLHLDRKIGGTEPVENTSIVYEKQKYRKESQGESSAVKIDLESLPLAESDENVLIMSNKNHKKDYDGDDDGNQNRYEMKDITSMNTSSL